MSEEEARAERQEILAKAIKETEKARAEAQEAAKQVGPSGEVLPKVPSGPPPEARRQQKIRPEKLERKQATGQVAGIREFFQRRGRQPKAERREGRMSAAAKSSRGVAMPDTLRKGPRFESSGRISTELSPVKAERLAVLRERVRAIFNRRELKELEKRYRRTRAQYPHDPEIRP